MLLGAIPIAIVWGLLIVMVAERGRSRGDARMRTVVALIALALPVMASQAQRDPKSYEAINEFVSRGWAFELGASLADLQAVGKVQREVVSTVKNRHVENQIDEIRELYYDGLYVKAYFPAKDYEGFLLEEVEITSQRFQIKHGLNVGASVAELQRVLGEPDEVEGGVHSYSGETDTVRFVIQNGVITKIRWELYLD